MISWKEFEAYRIVVQFIDNHIQTVPGSFKGRWIALMNKVAQNDEEHWRIWREFPSDLIAQFYESPVCGLRNTAAPKMQI